MKSTRGSSVQVAWWRCKAASVLSLVMFGLLAGLGGCSVDYSDDPDKRDAVVSDQHDGAPSETGSDDRDVAPDRRPQQETGSAEDREQFRLACVEAINELRATKGLPAYARWTSAESCTDEEANLDKGSGHAHGSFGRCGERGQNACPGWSMTNLRGCLQAMWDEKKQAGCSGCDDCADQSWLSCPNCDFYGSESGQVCGHYVNMSAKYLTKVSCGAASDGTWLIINFD